MCGCFRRGIKETMAIRGRQGCLREHLLTSLFCSSLTVTVQGDLRLSSPVPQ